MISRSRRAVTFGLAATALAAAVVPAAAATRAKPKPPPPLTIYPSTTTCPQGSGSATYALDTAPGDPKNDCLAFILGVSGGKPAGPRADEDYIATNHAKVKLAKSGSITGNIGIKATAFEVPNKAVGYADVTLTMTINGIEVGSIEKSGPITPTADLPVQFSWAIPRALQGKKIGAMDMLVHWNVAAGFTFVDVNAASLKIPRS